jgi:hypothetical protein
VTADASRTGKDPLLEQAWPREVGESFWAQLVGWSATDAQWDVALAGTGSRMKVQKGGRLI